MNIALAGEESAGVQVLRALAKSGHQLKMVLARPASGEGAGVSTWRVAKELGHEPLPGKLVKDPSFADKIRAEGIDLLLNVHSLYIIKPEILNAPRLGCFNLHPGPLPRFAGLFGPSWAVYRGETSYGVTLHHMLAGVDTGPIAYQAHFPVEQNATGLSVAAKCIRAGLPLIEALLEKAQAEPQAIPRLEQDLSQREYFGKEVPENGILDWNRPALEIDRFVRACDYLPFESPWGHPRAAYQGQAIHVVKAAPTGEPTDSPPGSIVAPPQGKGVRVACRDQWILVSKLKVGDKYVDAVTVLQPGQMVQTG